MALISTKIAFISVLWGMTRTSFFEKSHRILTPDLRQIYNDVVERGVTDATVESTLQSIGIGMKQTLRVNETQACKSIFHQTATQV